MIVVAQQLVVEKARSFIGTPFHHRGRVPGVGLDCAGVLICVARELGIVPEDFDVPDYESNPDGKLMMSWCVKHLGQRRNSSGDIKPGDVVVTRISQRPQHLGLAANYLWSDGVISMIHASNLPDQYSVIEQRLVFSPRQKFVAAFAFPGVLYG